MEHRFEARPRSSGTVWWSFPLVLCRSKPLCAGCPGRYRFPRGAFYLPCGQTQDRDAAGAGHDLYDRADDQYRDCLLYTSGSEVVHYCERPLPVGEQVEAVLDWQARLDHMQQMCIRDSGWLIVYRPSVKAACPVKACKSFACCS